MNPKKNTKAAPNQEMYRICPSKLTKHELEDLYFTVLETNVQLRKTIGEQQERIKLLSNRVSRKTAAQKLLQAEERNNCCVFTNIKVKQQKDSIEVLRRAHDRTAEKIRRLNTQVCTANQPSRFLPSCAQKASSKSMSRHSCCAVKQQGNSIPTVQNKASSKKTCTSVGTQTELLRDAILKPIETQTEPPQYRAVRLQSEGTQTERQSLQTNVNTFDSTGTQTEFPEYESAETTDTQTASTKYRGVSSQSDSAQTETQTNVKAFRSIGTQTELSDDVSSQSSDTQTNTSKDQMSETELQGDKRTQSTDIQNELKSDTISANTQTELQTDQESVSTDVQTELPKDEMSENYQIQRDQTSQSGNIQTELQKKGSQSRDIQTGLPKNDRSQSADIRNELPRQKKAQSKDIQAEVSKKNKSQSVDIQNQMKGNERYCSTDVRNELSKEEKTPYEAIQTEGENKNKSQSEDIQTEVAKNEKSRSVEIRIDSPKEERSQYEAVQTEGEAEERSQCEAICGTIHTEGAKTEKSPSVDSRNDLTKERRSQCGAIQAEGAKEEGLRFGTIHTEGAKNHRSRSEDIRNEMPKDEESADTKTIANENERSRSVDIQIDVPINETSRSVDIRNDSPNEERSQFGDIQTEGANKNKSQSEDIQTDGAKNGRLRSVDIRIDVPKEERPQYGTIHTEEIKNQRSLSEDIRNELPKDEAPADRKTIPNEKQTVSYEHDGTGQRQETLCDENKCRTLMDELQLKISDLMAELAKTHRTYSERISRLEIEVLEYRKENINLAEKLNNNTNGNKDSEPQELYWNQLVHNLRKNAGYAAELKRQLGLEKQRVSDLESQLKEVQSDAQPKESQSQLRYENEDNKDGSSGSEPSIRTWTCKCEPDCPNVICPLKRHVRPEVTQRTSGRPCESTCCSKTNTPMNSFISSYCTSRSEKIDYNNNNNDPKKSVNSNKYENVEQISSKNDGQSQTQTETEIRLSILSKRLSEGINMKKIAMKPFDDINIASTSHNRTSSSTKNSDGYQNCNKNQKESIVVLPVEDQMQTPVAKCRYTDDASYSMIDLSDFNETRKIYGVDKKCIQSKYNSNLLDCQKASVHRTSENKNDLPNVDECLVTQVNSEENKSVQKQDCGNKLNHTIDPKVSQNGTDSQNKVLPSKCKHRSESFENQETVNPSLLDKSLNDINEEQMKTVAELRRQLKSLKKSEPRTKADNATYSKLQADIADKIRDTSNIPLDTIGLMRTLSRYADCESTGKASEVAESAIKRSSMDPLNIKGDESKHNASQDQSIALTEDMISLLRLVSAYGGNIRKRPTESRESKTNSVPESPKRKTSFESINMNQQDTQTPSKKLHDKTYHVNDNRGTFSNINEVCKQLAQNELENKKKKEAKNVDENVPKNNKIVENGTQSALEKTVLNNNVQGSAPNDEESVFSMNNFLKYGQDSEKVVKTIDKGSQVGPSSNKIESPNDVTCLNTGAKLIQREVTTYRRKSGTLCFKTVPASKRSVLCQCDEQYFCDMAQYGPGVPKGGNCATGHIKCTYSAAPNRYPRNQIPSPVATDANRPSKQLSENVAHDMSLINYLNAKDENMLSIGSPMKNESISNQRTVLGSRTGSNKRTRATLESITEELSRQTEITHPSKPTGLGIQNTLETKASEEVLNEFDAGYQLKQGTTWNSATENFLPRCVFVLHIGTVVLSDEAVSISRGKSMGLTWKFYDQDITTTHMRAGRVVVFDFSTEYDMNLTYEFLNYMKHDELQIMICQLDEPNKPIASCLLPLRDALLNANRRADMSLALVAGPQTLYTSHRINVSDNLDAGDEMGVLDLWCMLRVDANFMHLINEAISQHSKAVAGQYRDSGAYHLKRYKKTTSNTDYDLSKKQQSLESEHEKEVYCKLRGWGSSILRLPSREVSKDSIDRNNNIAENHTSAIDENIQECKHRDSCGFRTPSTVDVDRGIQPRRKAMRNRYAKNSKKLNKEPSLPSATASSGVQYNDDLPDHLIINEVFANIRTSEDMKRVMNRSSIHGEGRLYEMDVGSYKNPKSKEINRQRTTSQDLSESAFLQPLSPTIQKKNSKKQEGEGTFSQSSSIEPTLLLAADSISKRSDITNINRKYDDIAKLYAKYDSQKEGARAEQLRKQVKINSKRSSQFLEPFEEPQKDKPDDDDDEQTIDIIVLWLALNEECEAMLDPRVQRVYVAYEFLGRSGADLETPVSLPKPKHYVDKCYFNFKKTFQVEKEDMLILGELARCRATSQVSKTGRDCIIFSVISEPPEDPLGFDICEDIGYAYLYLGDLIAYSAGSPGYTEVVPVRSRSGTSVCGVLAVRIEGLDVLRRCLDLVDLDLPPQMD